MKRWMFVARGLFLQRLKPGVGRVGFGMAEAVPLQSATKLQSAIIVVLMAGVLASSWWLAGCGYQRVGSVTHIPAAVRTLDVPIFQSKVQGFNTETAYTQAVVRELNTRTRYRVLTTNGANADATLHGTILTQTVAPLTYDPTSGQTSSYLVSVTASVVLTAEDGTVLYRNDAFAWHEQYQSTQDLSGFVQEDSAAVRRMARDFAEALVSGMTESLQ